MASSVLQTAYAWIERATVLLGVPLVQSISKKKRDLIMENRAPGIFLHPIATQALLLTLQLLLWLLCVA